MTLVSTVYDENWLATKTTRFIYYLEISIKMQYSVMENHEVLKVMSAEEWLENKVSSQFGKSERWEWGGGIGEWKEVWGKRIRKKGEGGKWVKNMTMACCVQL